MGAEFTVGKRWWILALMLEGVAVLAGLVSAAVTSSAWFIQAASLVALVAAILGFFCQRSADRSGELGEQTRRMIIYADGLGWLAGPATETALRRRFGWWAKRVAQGMPHPPSPYYESVRPPGPRRLLDHLQESVFFQAELSARMAGISRWATVLIGLVTLVGIILALTTLPNQGACDIAAKVLATGVLFLITTRLGLLWWDYHSQDAALHHLDGLLETLWKQRVAPSSADVLPLAHEYDIAVLKAPPVPDIVYRRNRAELNNLWRGRG